MPHKPEHKGVINALIDHELDVQQLVEQVSKEAPSAAKQLTAVTKRVFALRAQGKVNAQRAKQLLRDARKAILLAHFAGHVHELKKSTDAAVDRQLAEIRKLGRPVRELAPIQDADKLARAGERKQAKEGTHG